MTVRRLFGYLCASLPPSSPPSLRPSLLPSLPGGRVDQHRARAHADCSLALPTRPPQVLLHRQRRSAPTFPSSLPPSLTCLLISILNSSPSLPPVPPSPGMYRLFDDEEAGPGAPQGLTTLVRAPPQGMGGGTGGGGGGGRRR